MAEVVFMYEGNTIAIQCNENQKMKEICSKFCNKINIDLNSLHFLYGGNLLNTNKKMNEITKEKKITVLGFKNENEICSKCGRVLTNEKIDGIISINNNINNTLLGLNNQIENIINNLTKKKDIKYVNTQLKNMTIIINKVNEDIKKINQELLMEKNTIIANNNDIQDTSPKINIINENITHKNNINDIKSDINTNINPLDINNEIICIYNKQENEISLLHDYKCSWSDERGKLYIEAKRNINENHVEIYINDKKIQFTYKYKSKEKGEIKVKLKFNKLLTSTFYMFYGCSSLKSIDLSSFDSSDVNNMYGMFRDCSSLKSINFSSFNTSSVISMKNMFYGCSSLKSLDLSSFDTTNVDNLGYMFYGCSSLKSIDLSSFNTAKVDNFSCMFFGCTSLKKENIKVNDSGKKILEQL